MADPVAPELDTPKFGELITRTLGFADLEVRGDGRTVYGVVVPFERETVINGPGGKYREVFRPGAFTRSINAGVSRVKLFENHNHLRGKSPIGVATSLREEGKVLVGEFRVARTHDGDEALQKIDDGVLDAFSIGFADVPGKSIRSKDLVERTEVKLHEVSLVSYPAYEDAAIAGIRAAFPELTGEVLERLLVLAEDLATRQPEPALVGTSDGDSAIRHDDPALSHSSTEPGAEAPPPIDKSFAARQQRGRLIEAQQRRLGKRV